MINGSQILNTIGAMKEATPELQKLKKATDGLEAFMFKTLLQQMGGEKGLFGSSVPGASIYKDMFESNLSDMMAERGSLGISKTIYDKVAPLAFSQARERLKNSKIETEI